MAKPDSTKQQAVTRRKNGTFAPGASGNPGGRSGQAMKIRAKLAEGADEVTAMVLDAARNGDMTAARLVLERIAPPIKPQAEAVQFTIPNDATPADTARAIMAAAAAGQITPDTAQALLAAVADVVRIVEATEIQQRLEALEQAAQATKR